MRCGDLSSTACFQCHRLGISDPRHDYYHHILDYLTIFVKSFTCQDCDELLMVWNECFSPAQEEEEEEEVRWKKGKTKGNTEKKRDNRDSVYKYIDVGVLKPRKLWPFPHPPSRAGRNVALSLSYNLIPRLNYPQTFLLKICSAPPTSFITSLHSTLFSKIVQVRPPWIMPNFRPSSALLDILIDHHHTRPLV